MIRLTPAQVNLPGSLASWTVTNAKSHERIEKALFSDRPECDQDQK